MGSDGSKLLHNIGTVDQCGLQIYNILHLILIDAHSHQTTLVIF